MQLAKSLFAAHGWLSVFDCQHSIRMDQKLHQERLKKLAAKQIISKYQALLDEARRKEPIPPSILRAGGLSSVPEDHGISPAHGW